MTKLLSPAGDWPSLRAAVEAGADEVYIGLKQLSMRAFARNFDLSELKKVADFCHENDVKLNLTLNTIIYDEELETIQKILQEAKQVGIDAVICWDLSVIQLCNKVGIGFHVSTQASIANKEAARFYGGLGAKRIILARELGIDQVKAIKDDIKKHLPGMEIEVFCHGAMCVSVSGRCFMSQELFGKSANRGECVQPCRREYTIKDADREFELTLGESYVMSPKDLCTIDFLDRLTSVADVIKIEGRMRSPEYVRTTTECYRKALDAIEDRIYTEELRQQLIKKLKTVYNRGFHSGFFLGKPSDQWTDAYGSKATTQKVFVGFVRNYYEQPKAAEIHIQSESIKIGDTIMFQGNKTGVFEQEVGSIQFNNKDVKQAKKGDRIGIKTERKVRPNDKVFIIRDVKSVD